MKEMTNLHWGILCDQGQALNTLGRLHRHYCGNLSPKAISKDVSFFDPQGVHSVQYSLRHLNPVKLDTVPCGQILRNSPSQNRTVSSRAGLLSGRGSGDR